MAICVKRSDHVFFFVFPSLPTRGIPSAYLGCCGCGCHLCCLYGHWVVVEVGYSPRLPCRPAGLCHLWLACWHARSIFYGVSARHPFIGLVSRACQSARLGYLLGGWLGRVRHLRPRAWAAVFVISGQGLGLLMFYSQLCLRNIRMLNVGTVVATLIDYRKMNVYAHLVHLTP